MQRTDPRDLHGEAFDVVVVGGGIHGAAIAREAVLRGARVLLAERDDFGAGTSSRSSKLVHGGVRYLEQGRIGLVREALAERERLLRAAPHLVRPLPMLMPHFDDGGKSFWKLRLGLRLYSWLAGRRTALPPPEALSADACRARFPGIRTRGLRGGVVYHDAATRDLPLTLAVVEAAAEAGALVSNHLEVTGTHGSSLRLRDRPTGADVDVRARHVVNAAGPQADTVRHRLGIESGDVVRTSRGSHLVLPPRSTDTALAAFLPDGRIQFVIPHDGGTLAGTTDVDEPAEGEPTVPEADVDYLLGALAWLLEPAPARGEVLFATCGWRSLPRQGGAPGKLAREAFTVTEPSPAGTVHTVVGGKLTTHRSFAERAVARMLGRAGGPSPSRTAPLPGGQGAGEASDPLWQRHGSRAAAVRALADGEPELLQPLCPHRPHLRVEALWGVAHQGAVTFVDLALRRLWHVRGPCLEETCLRALHGLFARTRPDASPAPDLGRDRAALAAAVHHMTGAATPRPDTYRNG